MGLVPFLPGLDMPYVYVHALTQRCFLSRISTQTLHRVLTASVDRCVEKRSGPSVIQPVTAEFGGRCQSGFCTLADMYVFQNKRQRWLFVHFLFCWENHFIQLLLPWSLICHSIVVSMIICVNGVFWIPKLRSCITYHLHFSPHSMNNAFFTYACAGMYVCQYVYQLCLCMHGCCVFVICVSCIHFDPCLTIVFFAMLKVCVFVLTCTLWSRLSHKVAGVCVYFDPYLMFMFITMLQVCMFWTMPCNYVYHSIAGVHACLFWLVLKSCLSQRSGVCVCGYFDPYLIFMFITKCCRWAYMLWMLTHTL